MKIRLADGSVREFKDGMNALQIAKELNQKLGKAAVAAKIDGTVTELTQAVPDGAALEILTFLDEDGKKAVWHTASHVLAQAVKRLYPEAKLAIGPATDSGFYYDFDTERPFTNEDLAKIEKEMKKIVAENIPLTKYTLPRAQAIEKMKAAGEPYKVELIEDLPEDAVISFYEQGTFTDLCAGPHAVSTGRVKVPKLLRTAGAYWRGNENNKMLHRIYGVAFPTQQELDAYLQQLKEAEERDHNKLGRELHYFTTNPLVGQGLPLLMPKGAKTIQLLQRFVEDEEERRGYVITKTPFMAKSDLYKISGHWDHYQDGMFILGDEEKDEEVLALRPMTCPFQYMIYNAEHHSYKDLPIRYAETSTLFRNEASGEMHGLIRVRQFTLAEGHIICTPGQLEEEFLGVLDLIQYNMKILGIENDVTYRFSKWDPNDKGKYIGDAEEWERVQGAMRTILDHTGLKYYEADGEAAFYGPKLDIQFKNVFGKEDTLFTVQIDFALAERFSMTYVDSDGQKKAPYIIHRSSIGCYERTLAMLIEKYAGALPMWMMSEEVRLMNITDEAAEYCHAFARRLRDAGIRASVDDRQEKIGYKIREARNERIPYMLVAGEKEIADGTFAVRRRGEGEIGSMAAEELLGLIVQQDRGKVIF
ncbi:threonine--tRNA ligase [Christensenella timonensis]|uniref:threonine--tRNA ligase n=1 Tax=Christensenella timonensis TaxID=1816678 RepID=UPI000835ACA5|nr:threonine--tRNA ligase [Christensenella timonensis]